MDAAGDFGGGARAVEPLFRPQALAAQQQGWLGEIHIATPRADEARRPARTARRAATRRLGAKGWAKHSTGSAGTGRGSCLCGVCQIRPWRRSRR